MVDIRSKEYRDILLHYFDGYEELCRELSELSCSLYTFSRFFKRTKNIELARSLGAVEQAIDEYRKKVAHYTYVEK